MSTETISQTVTSAVLNIPKTTLTIGFDEEPNDLFVNIYTGDKGLGFNVSSTSSTDDLSTTINGNSLDVVVSNAANFAGGYSVYTEKKNPFTGTVQKTDF